MEKYQQFRRNSLIKVTVRKRKKKKNENDKFQLTKEIGVLMCKIKANNKNEF